MTRKRKPSTRRKSGGFKYYDVFNDESFAVAYLEKERWGDDIECPLCHSKKIARKKDSIRIWKCHHCRQTFSVCTNTVMQRTHIPLRKWLKAYHMVVTHRDGLTIPMIVDELEISEWAAHYLLQRIRFAMWSDVLYYSGEYEIDETFMVGRNWNRHNGCMLSESEQIARTQIFFGIVERKTKNAKIFLVGNTTEATLLPIIKEHIKPGCQIYSDGNMTYKNLWENYRHATVIHSRREYVRGEVHTNTIESLWRTLKDDLREHMYVAHKYAQLYADETAFRFGKGSRIRYTKEECINNLLEYVFRAGRITYKQILSGEYVNMRGGAPPETPP